MHTIGTPNKPDYSLLFLISGLLSLINVLCLGAWASVQFLLPAEFSDFFPFYKTRPLHVSSAIFWIFFSALGCIINFLPQVTGKKIYSDRLLIIQWILYTSAMLGMNILYSVGVYSGREYLEYTPYMSLPVIVSWLIWLYNYYKSVHSTLDRWPIYLVMWTTGIIFFLITFMEGHLQLLSYFNNNIIRDMTVHWKSLGAFVGSWNMMVYGIAFFLIEKISCDKNYMYSKLAFALYFIALLNMLLGWGHHTYHIPHALWLKQLTMLINLLELVILAKVLHTWFKSLPSKKFKTMKISVFFLTVSDIWIWLNLGLAIVISVPFINTFIHGTHVVVAHAMGSMIGINSFILLAGIFYILEQSDSILNQKVIKRSFIWLNIFFFIFWISLIIAGMLRGKFTLITNYDGFQNILENIQPYLIAFTVAGNLMVILFLMIIIPALRVLIKRTGYF